MTSSIAVFPFVEAIKPFNTLTGALLLGIVFLSAFILAIVIDLGKVKE